MRTYGAIAGAAGIMLAVGLFGTGQSERLDLEAGVAEIGVSGQPGYVVTSVRLPSGTMAQTNQDLLSEARVALAEDPKLDGVPGARDDLEQQVRDLESLLRDVTAVEFHDVVSVDEAMSGRVELPAAADRVNIDTAASDGDDEPTFTIGTGTRDMDAATNYTTYMRTPKGNSSSDTGKLNAQRGRTVCFPFNGWCTFARDTSPLVPAWQHAVPGRTYY
jgi:hypothetical protein